MARDPARSSQFATVLRQHRVAAALSQEALAEKAGLSTRAISDLERGVKTRPHLETVRLLADALDLDAAARATLAAAARGLLEERIAATPQTRGPSPWPRLATELIGRADERQRCRDMLREAGNRLVTLIGPGGVGKTRLAVAIADDLREHYPDGVVFVGLAAITGAPEASPVFPALARALGIEPGTDRSVTTAVLAHLATRRCLIVLDNCEHVTAATGPAVGAILDAAPHVDLLATSRTPLRLMAERLFPVPPLAVPDDAQRERAGELARVPAVDLFLRRARAVDPAVTLTRANAADVIAICRALDGLPLALELAALRTRVVPLTSMRQLLADRLRLLDAGAHDAPERHRTLRATISWSHDLLSTEAQALFRCLAVFAGGATWDQVTALFAGGDPFRALQGIEELVDQSLVQMTTGAGGTPRYVMLDTIRVYAAELLGQSGEEDTIRAAHARHFLDLAEEAEPRLSGPDQAAWLRILDAEDDNLHAALEWWLARSDQEMALRMGAALWPYWARRGRIVEGWDALERVLALGAGGNPLIRAKTMHRLGSLAIDRGDYRRARELYQASLDLRRRIDDPIGIADSLNGLGIVAADQGDYDRARALHEEALAARRANGDRDGEARSLYNLGLLALATGDHAVAHAHLTRASGLWQSLGDEAGVAYAAFGMAQAERQRGNLAAAAQLLERALTTLETMGDTLGAACVAQEQGRLAHFQGNAAVALARFHTALVTEHRVRERFLLLSCIEGIAQVAYNNGQVVQAVHLLSFTSSARHAMGTPVPPAEQAERARLEKCSRHVLGETFDAAWQHGADMDLDSTVAEALTLATG